MNPENPAPSYEMTFVKSLMRADFIECFTYCFKEPSERHWERALQITTGLDQSLIRGLTGQ